MNTEEQKQNNRIKRIPAGRRTDSGKTEAVSGSILNSQSNLRPVTQTLGVHLG